MGLFNAHGLAPFGSARTLHRSELAHRLDLVGSRRDVVSIEDRSRLVATERHARLLRHASADQVAHGGATEIVEQTAGDSGLLARRAPAVVVPAAHVSTVAVGHPRAEPARLPLEGRGRLTELAQQDLEARVRAKGERPRLARLRRAALKADCRAVTPPDVRRTSRHPTFASKSAVAEPAGASSHGPSAQVDGIRLRAGS